MTMAARGQSSEAAERPSGPVAAVQLATGIGARVFAHKGVVAYDQEVGPLSGKTIWGVVAFAVSWLILGVALRNRNPALRTVAIVAGALLVLALIGTFAPFFQLFAPDE